MKVKIFEADAVSQIETKFNQWLEYSSDIEIIQITPSFHCVHDLNYSGDILNQWGSYTWTIIYKETEKSSKSKLLNIYMLLIEEGKGRGDEALFLRKKLEDSLGSGHSDLQRADMMLKFFE